jgi:hypothetical protein
MNRRLVYKWIQRFMQEGLKGQTDRDPYGAAASSHASMTLGISTAWALDSVIYDKKTRKVDKNSNSHPQGWPLLLTHLWS